MTHSVVIQYRSKVNNNFVSLSSSSDNSSMQMTYFCFINGLCYRAVVPTFQ